MGSPCVINSNEFTIKCNRCGNENVHFAYNDGDIEIVCDSCEKEISEYESIKDIIDSLTSVDNCRLNTDIVANLLCILDDLPTPLVNYMVQNIDLTSYVVNYKNEDYYLTDFEKEITGIIAWFIDERTESKYIKIDMGKDIIENKR